MADASLEHPGAPQLAVLANSDKYDVLRKLGEGGMGSVWLAKHTLLDCLVAIKVMTPDGPAHQDSRERFLREMRAIGTFQHPHLVRAYDAERSGGALILVMEYVDGVTLDTLVWRTGPLVPAVACRLIAQAAEALQYAHERGLVHRDVKPGNLMITRADEQVKVLDFGLARVTRQPASGSQTAVQTFMGTPDYVAPEQAADAATADIRADIYSLGCTLYFLLTGAPPLVRETTLETLTAHQRDEPPPLREANPAVSAELAAVVGRLLAKDPEDRYQTPAEVVAALRPLADGAAQPVFVPDDIGISPTLPPSITAKPGQTPRPQPAARGRAVSRAVVAVAAVALLALAVGVTLWRSGPPAAPVPPPEEKSLTELLQPGSVWIGKYKFRTDDQHEGRLKLLVEARDGDAFTGLHVARKLDGTALAHAVPVRGTVCGDDLHYQPIAFDDYSVAGSYKAGRLAVVFDNTKAHTQADCELTPRPPQEPSARLVASWFAAGDEGWHTLNHDGSRDATGLVAVRRRDHDQFLWTRDVPNEKEWGWHAPKKYHGDHAGKFGKYLIYDLFTSRRGTVPVKDWYVRLDGGGRTIFLTGATVAAPVPDQWRSYRFRLDGSEAWKKWDATKNAPVPATNDDIKAVLANVTGLRIKGEFFAASNDGGLGNVEFGADD